MARIHTSYQRRFIGKDFRDKILNGLNLLGEPAPWVEEMLQDTEQDKALILAASGLKVGEVGASYMAEIRVFYPKLKEEVWKNHKILKHYKSYTLQELKTLLNETSKPES